MFDLFFSICKESYVIEIVTVFHVGCCNEYIMANDT